MYHTLGGESQAGWSHNMTLTASTSGVSAYKFYDSSKWATFGLMGGYASINVDDYPNWKVYFEGTSPLNSQVTYKMDGTDKYPGGGGQETFSGTFTGTEVTSFSVQCTSAESCVVLIKDVVFYKDNEATGIHPDYVKGDWGGDFLTKDISYTARYGTVYIPELDNARNKKVTIKTDKAIPTGINLYYKKDSSTGAEEWISLAGKTEYSLDVVGTIYAIGLQCDVEEASELSPVNVPNITVYSEDLPTVTYGAPISEISLNTLTYYSSGNPNEPVWNINKDDGTIYGKADTGKNFEHVDLDEYDELRIYQTKGDPVRVFMWNKTKDEVVTINTSSTPVKMTWVDDTYYKLDLSAVKSNYDHAYLNSIKASAWNTTATVSAVNVVTSSDDVDCVLMGDGAYGLLSDEATTAINNAGYTAIDVSRIKNGSELTLNPANLNCLFVANAANTIANTNNVIVNGTCNNLVLTDGYPFKAPVDFTANAASYTRDLGTAGAGTLCLPFAAAIPGGVTAYTLTYTSGDKAAATPVETTIPANTPVLLNGSDEKVFTGSGAVSASTANKSGALTGVFEATTVPVNSYVLQNGTSGLGFYKVESGDIVANPFRAYLTAAYSARSISITYGGVTGINDVKAKKVGEKDVYYNLNGQRVSNPTKGVFIKNGVKVSF